MEERPGEAFTIGGKTFWLYDLVWGQLRWLYQSLKAYPLHALKAEHIAALLESELSRILAIILVEDGRTQAQKVEAGLSAVQDLAAWFDAHLRPAEAAPVVQRFFDPARLQQMALELGSLMAIQTPTGSNAPSSLSPTGT